MLYLDKLRDNPLYELDLESLASINRPLATFTGICHMVHNYYQIIDSVPLSVLKDCGLSYELWYPFPRRLWGILRFQRARKALVPHCQQALERVRERTGVRCAPLKAS